MNKANRMVTLAKAKLGDRYVFGSTVPKNDPDWPGPWDCAEFASWLVYQVTGRLFGCHDNRTDPARANAFTGYWRRDTEAQGAEISVAEAADLPGAFVLRFPLDGRTGHIALCEGEGRTLEAMGTDQGVCAGGVAGRSWDIGVRIPFLAYDPPARPYQPRPPTPVAVLRLGSVGEPVRALQEALKARGFDPGARDGVFGQRTESAIRAFQQRRGLAVDGEAGAATTKALGLSA